MKRLTITLFVLLAMMITVPVQAQSDFDLNRDFKENLVPMSNIYGGRVVGIKTYLSIREEPSVYSREVMRIPNGTELLLRDAGPVSRTGWWQVISVKFNGREYSDTVALGWISAKYVKTY